MTVRHSPVAIPRWREEAKKLEKQKTFSGSQTTLYLIWSILGEVRVNFLADINMSV